VKTVLLLTQQMIFQLKPYTFSNLFGRQVSIDIGLQLIGILLSPDLQIGTTLAILRLFGKLPIRIHSLITY